MSFINNEIFVGVLKYSKLFDLVKLVILSKECVDIVQDEIDKIYKLRGKLLEHSPIEQYIPLQFWFNHNTCLALPLVALQNQDILFNFEFKEIGLDIGIN